MSRIAIYVLTPEDMQLYSSIYQSRAATFATGSGLRVAARASRISAWAVACCASAVSRQKRGSSASNVLSYAESQAASDVGHELAAFASIPFDPDDL